MLPLKQLASILMLGLFLFYGVGHQAWYHYQLAQANNRLEARLDKAGYNEAELQTIVVPLHLPYLYNQASFERVDGEINLNGITYKYVQRRVWHDSLYLQCLPHHEAMQLAAAQAHNVEALNGVPQQKGSFYKVSCPLSKHFTGAFFVPHPHSATALGSRRNTLLQPPRLLPQDGFGAGPEQPPEGRV